MSSQNVIADLNSLRNMVPVTHNITNFVVMNSTANALLAVGAAPIMAHAPEELDEIVAISHALVVNIGTLRKPWIDSMYQAMHAAREKGIPVVLDPVGAGASKLRTDTAMGLLQETGPSIIRGNASEIRAMCYADAATRGVDSSHGADEALDAAQELSAKYNCVVSISGETDLIVDKDQVTEISNGDAMMPKVTGLGCTASSLTGAFAAASDSQVQGAASAMAVMGIAGEMAAEKAEGPGSFQMYFLDALHQIDEEAVKSRLKMEEA
ncbi:hydroxyethylthiazole kinase [Planctomycetota bacterium]